MHKFFFLAIVVTFISSCTDYGKLEKQADLDRKLAEISGLARLNNNQNIYAVTDHGNPNHIFVLNPKGTITQELVVKNVENEDWEDLASDGKRLFIGDFGNNENDRTELAVHIVDTFPSSEKVIDTVEARTINFKLSDQSQYPPKLSDWNFDIESIIYFNEQLYLFTRNRSRGDFEGTVKVYKLPIQSGNYIAQLISTYNVCNDVNTCYITGAVARQDTKEILLLTSDKILKLSNFTKDNFFKGKIETIDLKHNSRKEGIAYRDSSSVYIVDERRAQTGGKLYTYSF